MVKQYLQIAKTLLKPDLLCESVEDIPLENLYYKGYRVLFLDIDNTLVSYEKHSLSLQKMQWIARAKSLGFSLFVISNNSSYRRIERIAKQMDVGGLYFSLKPFTLSLRELAKDHNITLEKSIFVGDKLFTDVLIGNWVKSYTVLVDPLDKRLSFFKTLQRDIEVFFLKKIEKHF